MFTVAGEKYLTKDELAARWHCTKRSIELWRKENKIPQPVTFDKPPTPVEAGYHRVAWKLTDVQAHEKKVREQCMA